jgi:hypothetical protein
MIISSLSALCSACFKAGLFFSHLKFLAAILLLNVHAVIHHLWYGFVFNHVRPLLSWSPL